MKILGYEFKLFKEQKKPSIKKNEEIGSTGTSIVGGYLSDTDYVPELTGSSALTIYDEMRKSDGVVKASLLACQLPIRATNWFVEPASDDDLDIEVAEFVEYNLMNNMTITWDDFLRQALLMLPFGYMIFEKVFTDIEWNGKQMIGIRKFAPRLPDTVLKWQTRDNKDGITQITIAKGEVSIPLDKLIIFVNEKEGDNWSGISVLRSAYRPWYFKKTIEKINAIAFERQGLGVPIIKLPEDHSKADIARAREMLKNVRANEQAYMILPSGWEFEYADPKAGNVKDPDKSIQRYNREMLICVLAQFLDLGSGPTGSRALSVDQSTTFHNNLTAIAKQIQDAINKYAVKQLVDLNYNVQNYPELRFGRIGTIDYEKLTTSLKSVVDSGIVKSDDKLEAYLREVMDLPERTEEEETEKGKTKEEPKEELKKKASEKMIFWEPWRPLTFAEQKVDFKIINKKLVESEEALKKELKNVMSPAKDDFILQIERILNTKSISERNKRIANLSMKYQNDYRAKILESMKEVYAFGKTSVAHEMKNKVPATPQEYISNMSLQATALTDKMNSDITETAKTTMLTNLQQKKTKPQTLAITTEMIKKSVDKYWQNTPPVVVSGSLNQGRRTTMDKYQSDIYAVQRSEILDSRTCDYCLSIDGRVLKKKDAMLKMDAVHSNCRGIWVEIMKNEEVKPPITGVPESLRGNWGGMINLVKQPSKPIVRKDSYVVKNHPELLAKK
jgi:hypothetical protein